MARHCWPAAVDDGEHCCSPRFSYHHWEHCKQQPRSVSGFARRCATFTARLLTYGLEKKDSAFVAVHRTGCQGSFSCYLLEEGYMRGGATKSHPPHPHEAQE